MEGSFACMIVVDQNIPYGLEAFSSAGEVVRVPGRDIRPEQVRDATALIVRSITKVNASLLEGSSVRFVGTCTIGTDHLDIPWLESRGIAWSSAPGCNARSVAEYVVAALALAHRRGRCDLSKAPPAGVVGVGRVGRQVASALESLGLPVLRNDPPRAEIEGSSGFVGLPELLSRCSIVCAHLPLTREGTHATAGLLSWDLLRALPRGALFLNAGRGPTSPSEGLRRLMQDRPDLTLVLDVWDPEPVLPVDIAAGSLVATPHIAGYSFEGKVEGTRMIRHQLGLLENLPAWEAPFLELAPLPDSIRPGQDSWTMLCDLILAAYDLEGDDSRTRAILPLPDVARGESFDRLRKEYPIRREFRHRPVNDWNALPPSVRTMAIRLGFGPAAEIPNRN